jgi:hypothetical protein
MLADRADGFREPARHRAEAVIFWPTPPTAQPGATLATFISEFWSDQLVAHDKQWLFLVLVGLVGSFAFIRLSTRLMRSPRVPWWPGSVVSDSGVHLHHLVFGIVLMMVAGTLSFAGFATSPLYEICAFLFGVGIGLTIDEFALWVHLDDVYWAKEGRSSVDATVISAGALGLILIGVRPFDVNTGSGSGDIVATAVGTAIVLALVAICLAKQRLMHGVIGVFLFPLAIYGASRIGKPGSTWARRFYGERNPRKQAKAERRFAPGRRTDRLKESLRDAIGGVTETEYQTKLAQREAKAAAEAATLEAAERVRERAEMTRASDPESR